MKHLKYILLLFIFFSGATTAFAQYYDPYIDTGAGVDRRIARQRSAPRTKNKDASKKKIDLVEATIKQLKKKLNLDDFQEAAITVVYNDNKDKIYSIAEEDIPTKAKKQKMKDISEKIDSEILKLLSDEQVKKYQKMINKRKY
ncbi:MAG: hypothetical protein BM557_10840 [Flavobacterium sp. MedPE-SWcel]|uniref:hypothetical protein n=1 Tax=uncultured Flavobacterium sp. TaxID=165435 RepID=UPI000920EF83|nr:hypothetical protein [uncultured Flavobacterium sp.]OIQ15792.1 MAG: hypothetical protein BM557_10840 [Flavobacterium sp. MedPE-SWcel]